MKKVKALLALAMVGAFALSMTACGASAPADDAAAPATEEAAPAAEEVSAPAEAADVSAPAEAMPEGSYTVGVIQFVQHPALDAATEGFQDALNDIMGEGAVTFDVQNASGEVPNCATIVGGFTDGGYDLIMANATPPLQAAASATADIPILGTSVTDYASALDISDWTGTVGTNVSGTSDLAPLDQQAEMLVELFPEAQTVGILYCTGEANSVYQCDVVEAALTDLGLSVERFGFNDTNDVNSVTTAACESCDVIYIPTDNTAAANTEAIANIVIPAGVPVIAGEEGICSGCGVATLSISYYDLGYATGEMAAAILQGEDVSTMPVQYAPETTKKYNAANCEALGIEVPEGYEAIEVEE